MADLFLSYAREDSDCAEALANALETRGWSVWWDRRVLTGQTFAKVIERELTAARAVIVLWSHKSVESSWVQNEATDAAERDALVPVRIEDVKPPLAFRGLQTADLLNWQSGFGGREFEACLASIDALVRRTVVTARPRRPSEAGTRPVPPTVQLPPPRPTPKSERPPPPPVSVPVAATAAISSFMLPAVLVTIGCCPVLGIVAIVYASQVNAKLGAGDVAGAAIASQSAKRWAVIGFIAGLVSWGLYFAYMAMQQQGY